MSQSYASVDPAGGGGIVIVLAKVNAQGMCAKVGTVERPRLIGRGQASGE